MRVRGLHRGGAGVKTAQKQRKQNRVFDRARHAGKMNVETLCHSSLNEKHCSSSTYQCFSEEASC